MKKAKVAIAMSGGIDSSFAAYLLSKEGYEAEGITFTIPFASDEMPKRARHVCDVLGISHHIIDISEQFKEEVIRYFLTSYLRGLTPNPCCRCNRSIKFGTMLEAAQNKGCSFLATGHYARIGGFGNEPYLIAAGSGKKSQEYFLALVPKEKFERVLFPLGDYTKEQVRSQIEETGIYPFAIKESQEVCFIQDTKYKKFIEEHIPDFHTYYGTIRHLDGTVLGTHKGIYSLTYGQRDGLGISWKEPLYVLDINPETKEVVVGEKEHALREYFTINGINWFYPPGEYNDITVRIRYNARKLDCSLKAIDTERAQCSLKKDKDIPSPGQVAVFYDNDKVIAGGWIEKENISHKR